MLVPTATRRIHQPASSAEDCASKPRLQFQGETNERLSLQRTTDDVNMADAQGGPQNSQDLTVSLQVQNVRVLLAQKTNYSTFLVVGFRSISAATNARPFSTNV